MKPNYPSAPVPSAPQTVRRHDTNHGQLSVLHSVETRLAAKSDRNPGGQQLKAHETDDDDDDAHIKSKSEHDLTGKKRDRGTLTPMAFLLIAEDVTDRRQ
jgi:hypothetical protein